MPFSSDTIEKLKDKLPSLRQELQDDHNFKEFYMFIFEYGKPITQKSMALDVAIELWKWVLTNRFKFLDLWVEVIRVCYFLLLALVSSYTCLG